MHAAAREFVEAHAERSVPTVEFGARNVNGGLADLFTDRYVGVDIADGDGVDVVADCATFSIAERWGHLAGQVVCCEVLEHCEGWRAIVANALANLAPGGRLIMTCATTGRPPHSAFDGGPVRDGEYYANVPVEEFVECVAGAGGMVATVVSDRSAGDLQAVVLKVA